MAKIITCQVQVLDGSNINIDVNVSSTAGERTESSSLWLERESATPSARALFAAPQQNIVPSYYTASMLAMVSYLSQLLLSPL